MVGIFDSFTMCVAGCECDPNATDVTDVTDVTRGATVTERKLAVAQSAGTAGAANIFDSRPM